MTDQAVGVQAHVLLGNPKVAMFVRDADAKVEQVLHAAADRYAVSKDRVVRELARMAFADSRRYYDWTPEGARVKPSADLTDDEAAAVVEVSHTKTAEGGTIRVKLGDKRGALMDLARLLGYEAVRNLRIIKRIEDLSDDELAALAADEGVKESEGTRH